MLARITPGGTISKIIHFITAADGDGGEPCGPWGIAVDGADNVYLTRGFTDVGRGFGHNALKITPEGAITQIIDSSGDGTHALTNPSGVAVDTAGNVYVAGRNSNNVFKIAAEDAPPPLCDGDCNGDGQITVEEVITGVNLPMVLNALTKREGKAITELAQVLKENGRSNIYIASEILATNLRK